MIITGLYTYNNFLYFKTDKKEYILYRSGTQTRFLKDTPLEEITNEESIQNSIATHNSEVIIQAANNWDSYNRTKNPIFKRGALMFEYAIIQNKSFPVRVESEYETVK